MSLVPDISIVIPVYNEEGNVKTFILRTQKLFEDFKKIELIFCVDPSTDETERELNFFCRKYKNIKALYFSRRFGQPTAVMAGILNCTGKSCVVIDVDLQDPPELIPKMYKKLNEGYDVVYAKRKSRKGETFIKLIITYLGYKIINKIAQVNIPRNTGDYRIMSRRVVEELRRLPETHGFLRGLVALVGFKQVAIEYNREERYLGTGKYNRFFGSIKIGLNGLIGFSSFLLTMNLMAGIVIAFISFLLAIFIIINKLVFDAGYPLGTPTVIVLILFMGGVQLIGIGILGEYIARIYDEVKNRPRFIIEKSINFTKIIDDGNRK